MYHPPATLQDEPRAVFVTTVLRERKPKQRQRTRVRSRVVRCHRVYQRHPPQKQNPLDAARDNKLFGLLERGPYLLGKNHVPPRASTF